MKEIYSFTVSKEEEVSKEQVRKKKNKETGKMEEQKMITGCFEYWQKEFTKKGIAMPTIAAVLNADFNTRVGTEVMPLVEAFAALLKVWKFQKMTGLS